LAEVGFNVEDAEATYSKIELHQIVQSMEDIKNMAMEFYAWDTLAAALMDKYPDLQLNPYDWEEIDYAKTDE
jgi:hypothetical protein